MNEFVQGLPACRRCADGFVRGLPSCRNSVDEFVQRLPPTPEVHERIRFVGEDHPARARPRAPRDIPGAGHRGDGEGYPRFVEREFRRYLDCGLLCNGFARLRCPSCGHESLVAFSCKGQLCPSCMGRRTAEIAASLVDEVFPEAAYRQWVLTFPWSLRFPLAVDRDLLATLTRGPPGARRRAGGSGLGSDVVVRAAFRPGEGRGGSTRCRPARGGRERARVIESFRRRRPHGGGGLGRGASGGAGERRSGKAAARRSRRCRVSSIHSGST